jgi:hypothetical protein
MYLPLSTTIAIEDKSQKFLDLADVLFAAVPAGEPVFVASANPLFWSVVERHKLVWPSRASSLWMLPAIARSELVGPSTPELKEMARQLNSTIHEDLRCNPPAIILFPDSIPVGNGKYEFSIGGFLFRDPNLRQFIERNYLLTEKPDGVHAYMRKNAVRRAPDINCRIVR